MRLPVVRYVIWEGDDDALFVDDSTGYVPRHGESVYIVQVRNQDKHEEVIEGVVRHVTSQLTVIESKPFVKAGIVQHDYTTTVEVRVYLAI